jgi:pimeloyl-ACP methyl ester carboxylesterase
MASTPEFHPFTSERARQEFVEFYQEKAKRWPIPCETRVVDTPSGQTLVRMSGRAGDPPLVLLPGARGSSLMWIPNIAALSRQHRTYALDLITDVGLSVLRREFGTAEAYVTWLDEVFDVLFPEARFDLLGISYGGWVASVYASRRPARLRKLVLLAPGGAVLRLSWSFFITVLLLSIHLPGRRERRGGERLRRMIRWLFADTLRSAGADGEAIEQEIYDMIMAGRFLARPRLIWPTVFDDDEWRAFRVPTLFLVGENEKIYSPKAVVARLKRLAPTIRTEIIPGAGHDLTMVAAGLVDERILGFLDEPLPEDRAETPRTIPVRDEVGTRCGRLRR